MQHGPVVSGYWTEQNCLLHSFSRTLSEDSFTVILFPTLCGGISVLRELYRSRKINLLLYFPGRLHLIYSFHPESTIDTAQQGGCSALQCGRGAEKENEDEGNNPPFMPWALDWELQDYLLGHATKQPARISH